MRLQSLFKSDLTEMMRSLKELKQEVPDFQFKYEAMLAFWLAIDLEKSQEAVELYKMEPLI